MLRNNIYNNKSPLFIIVGKSELNLILFNTQCYFTDFDDSEDDWESVNTTEFINETAHQLHDFVDRYFIQLSNLWSRRNSPGSLHRVTCLGTCTYLFD